jgi:hypothetical protein
MERRNAVDGVSFKSESTRNRHLLRHQEKLLQKLGSLDSSNCLASDDNSMCQQILPLPS